MDVSALRNEATVPPANPMAKRIPPCGKETQEARCEVVPCGSFPVLECAGLEERGTRRREKNCNQRGQHREFLVPQPQGTCLALLFLQGLRVVSVRDRSRRGSKESSVAGEVSDASSCRPQDA